MLPMFIIIFQKISLGTNIMTQAVKSLLENYASENTGVKTNLYRMLMHGKLAGTGKMVILPVDQGFEHGPDRSFAKNDAAYDPDYHFKLAIDAGLNAYAAPLGFLEASCDKFAGQVPLILKLNSSNSLLSSSLAPNQAYTSAVQDALRIGASAVGLTIYPGSDKSNAMFEEAREIVREAKSHGLAVVIWSYPRGSALKKEDETAIDVCAYAAHIAALLGANIIKVKPPTDHIAQSEAQKLLADNDFSSLKNRISHIVQSCFNGKRIVIFSGGASQNEEALLKQIEDIHLGGGNGSIIGRNSFQRQRQDALDLLDKICTIYSNRK